MANSVEEFEVTKYGFDREHEVALNEFQHALELEQLKLLILLNGGAATALLAFAEKSPNGIDRLLLASAIGAWLVGLLIGTWATISMRRLQREYATSLRYRRLATEWRRLAADLPNLDPGLIIGLPDEKTLKELQAEEAEQERVQGNNAILCDRAAKKVLKDARENKIEVETPIWISLGLFITGAILAMIMVLAPASADTAHRLEPATSSAPADLTP